MLSYGVRLACLTYHGSVETIGNSIMSFTKKLTLTDGWKERFFSGNTIAEMVHKNLNVDLQQNLNTHTHTIQFYSGLFYSKVSSFVMI